MADVAPPEVQQPVIFTLVVQWMPQSGQLRVNWPQVDDVAKLGMLEMAKQLLTEMRLKAGVAGSAPLVVPAGRLPHN